MEKFGVRTEKTATKCPECGAATTREGAVLLCPVHGSEPFETPTSTHGVDSVGFGEEPLS